MAYVGPIANSLNMSVEETASILGIMSDAGIEASQGGTALRGALTRLLKPSKQNIEAFRELGISTSDYRAGLLDFPEILDLIATNTAHLTDEQRASLIAMAFGTEAQTAMNALVNAGGDALRDMTTAAEGATGATREIANAIRDTPEFKFQQSLAQLRDVGIEIGSKLLPHVTSAISAFSSWVQSFNQLSSSTQDFIIKAGLFVAAVGPILTVLGSLTSGTGKVITAVGSMIQAFGKITTPKAIGEIGGALGQIPGQASAAGGSATLFSNPWVAGAAVVTAAVAGIGYLIYKEATKYEASHRESVKETEGAYQEWFDAVVSGSATAASAQDQIRASTEQTGETYHQVAERIKRQNHEIQQSIDDMWDGVVRESRMTGQIQVLQTSLRDALSQIISQEDVNYLEGQFNDLGVMLTNTLTEIGVAYNNNRVVTAEWAIAQVDNVNRVRESVVSNLQLQRDALIQTATKEAEYHANSEQWLQQETSRIEQQYEHRVGVVDRATATITEILQTAAQTGSAITDEEMVSMARSIQDFAKVSGQSLTEMGEAGELVGEALRGLATDAGLDILELSGIIDSETADMIRSMSDAEDRTNALWDALSQYDQYEPSMKILDVDAEQAMADIQAAIEAGATWEEFTPEEKVFMMQTMGEEAVKLLLATIGIDWNDLTPEEKELIANADSAEDVEEIIHQIGDWNNLSPEDKILNLEAQVANDNLLEIIRNKELWNNTDFYAQFIAIDTNAPDAEEQIIALIATHTGMSAEEIKSIMFETNASETAGELEVVSSRVEEINGQQVIIHTMSDGTEVTQAELEETGFIAQSIDGTNVGIAMGQTGAEETRGSIEGVGHSLSQVPESKTTSITSSLIGMVANLVTIGLYNAAVESMRDITVTAEANASTVSSATPEIDAYNTSSGAMSDTSVTASTSTPALPGDTGLIDDYNVSSGSMVDTSATASTNAPGLPGDTGLVDDWNSTTGAMTDNSSTASTSTPSIAGNTSAVWSWIGALDSTYSTSSSLTTYVDTVYRTFGSPTRAFAEGGHIGAFAEGGDIEWGGMFASGGNVPKGFMGIVGEAGPELFHVTKSGVSITPLAPNEKMRGVEGAIEDYLGKGKGGGDTVINITFKDPVVREETDFDRLATVVGDKLNKELNMTKLFRKGRA